MLFLGCSGFDTEVGLTTPNLAEAETNRTLIRVARRVVVLADHTKWNLVSLSSFARLSEVNVLVTDDMLPARPAASWPSRSARSSTRRACSPGMSPRSPERAAPRSRAGKGLARSAVPGRRPGSRSSVGRDDRAGRRLPGALGDEPCSARRMASSIRVSTIWDSGTVAITLPRTKIWPLPLPEATPRSASRASPGPFTTQPMTATRSGTSMPSARRSPLRPACTRRPGRGRRTGRRRSPGRAGACRSTPGSRCRP